MIGYGVVVVVIGLGGLLASVSSLRREGIGAFWTKNLTVSAVILAVGILLLAVGIAE